MMLRRLAVVGAAAAIAISPLAAGSALAATHAAAHHEHGGHGHGHGADHKPKPKPKPRPTPFVAVGVVSSTDTSTATTTGTALPQLVTSTTDTSTAGTLTFVVKGGNLKSLRGKPLTVNVAGKARVTLNGKRVTLDKLAAGDHVVVLGVRNGDTYTALLVAAQRRGAGGHPDDHAARHSG